MTQIRILTVAIPFMMLLAPVYSGLVAEGETIKVLMIGQVFPFETPVAGWLDADPAFEYVVVPVRKDTGGWADYPEKEARRYVRLYFPRDFQGLIGYDLLCYVDTYFGHLTGTQISYMYRGIRDEGLGGLTTLGGGISWVTDFRESWVSSSVGSAFPTSYLQPPDKVRYVYDFRIDVRESGGIPAVFLPFLDLGIERHIGRQAAELRAREGAQVFATMETLGGETVPFAVAWEYGKGITWSVATDIQSDYNMWWTRWGASSGYQYSMDLFLNMLLYSSKREIIQDVLRFHNVRDKFSLCRRSKSTVFSLLDFVERFGASREAIDREMDEVKVMEGEARELYLMQEIDAADEALDAVLDQLDAVSVRAIQLKNRALVWVYVVEWAAVTATLMVSGFVIWTIMVKRKLYRIGGTTRMA